MLILPAVNFSKIPFHPFPCTLLEVAPIERIPFPHSFHFLSTICLGVYKGQDLHPVTPLSFFFKNKILKRFNPPSLDLTPYTGLVYLSRCNASTFWYISVKKNLKNKRSEKKKKISRDSSFTLQYYLRPERERDEKRGMDCTLLYLTEISATFTDLDKP